jgi:hypothetical protein
VAPRLNDAHVPVDINAGQTLLGPRVGREDNRDPFCNCVDGRKQTLQNLRSATFEG